MTPLKGVDGKIYALAQGAVSIGGRNVKGTNTVSHATAGMVYGGGLVEREINIDLYSKKFATLSLKEADFRNSVAIQKVVNDYYSSQVAVAIDPRTIRLKCPENKSMVEFLAQVQQLSLDYKPADKIIINERTGTIIAGIGIKVKPVVMTHGDITIKIK